MGVRHVLGRLLGATLVVALGLVVVGAEDWPYRFVDPEHLAADLAPGSERVDDVVGKPVEVVDELVTVWEDQTLPAVYRFDTTHLRCLVPRSETASIDHLRGLEAERARGRYRPPLVVLLGTPIRATQWGDVAANAQGRVQPEAIVLMVDRVEPARERHYADWLAQRRAGLR